MPGTAFSTSNWTGYDEATVTNPSAELTDFTLVIQISRLSSTWKGNIQSDGADIRVTKGDNTEIPFDLIGFAYNAGAPTGAIRCKWSSSLAISGTQKVRVWAKYTGGTAIAYDAIETYGKNNAYASHWKGYWPGGGVTDRTSNGRTLTIHDSLAVSTGTGLFDLPATDYPGGGASGLLYRSEGIVTASPLSLVTLTSFDAGAGNHSLVCVTDFSAFDQFFTVTGAGNTAGDPLQAAVRGGSTSTAQATTGYTVGQWTSLAAVFDTGTNTAMLKDGGSKGTATSSINPTGIDHFQLGALARSSDYYHTNVFNGKIAEAQIHSTALSDAWLLHESDQTLDQATFWGTWAWTAAAGGAITGTLTGSSESVRGVLAGTRTVTGTLVSQVGT